MMGHSESEKPVVCGTERRASVRVVYETLLLVAELDEKDFPPFSAFWEVTTSNLSPTGIGFRSSKRPQSVTLMLMLGNPQANPIFVKARVTNCTESTLENGEREYLVGCELLERIKA